MTRNFLFEKDLDGGYDENADHPSNEPPSLCDHERPSEVRLLAQKLDGRGFELGQLPPIHKGYKNHQN